MHDSMPSTINLRNHNSLQRELIRALAPDMVSQVWFWYATLGVFPGVGSFVAPVAWPILQMDRQLVTKLELPWSPAYSKLFLWDFYITLICEVSQTNVCAVGVSLPASAG